MHRQKIIVVNYLIVFYFILIWFINFFKVDFVILGVFRELLTIPFLAAQLLFLGIGIRYLLKNQKDFMVLISVIVLALCSIITLGSFFV